jgi:hypothetical protein
VLVALAAGWHTWRGVWLEAQVERELGRPDVEAPAGEPAEVAAARDELDELTTWLVDLPDETRSFGAPYQLTPDNAAAIEAGVHERAPFFEALERLPASLWDTEGSPRIESARLMRTSLGVYALSARAWLSARAGDGVSAGRDLARALAILRVTDNGGVIGLGIRTSLEWSAADTADRLLTDSSLDREAFMAPIEVELERSLAQDRVARMLATDVRDVLMWQHEQCSELPWWRVWWERPRVLAGYLELLELRDECRRALAADPTGPLPVEEAWLPFYGEEHGISRYWGAFAQAHGECRARLVELLEPSG